LVISLLDINANFKTTGELDVQSTGGTSPTVEVAADVTAEFDAT